MEREESVVQAPLGLEGKVPDLRKEAFWFLGEEGEEIGQPPPPHFRRDPPVILCGTHNFPQSMSIHHGYMFMDGIGVEMTI